MNTRFERAIDALRKPDPSLANVANTVRQSLAEAFEVQQARIEALEAALREAERFMTYFADGTTSFVGPGTPISCLAKIRAALELSK
jgi:hypothetical protein